MIGAMVVCRFASGEVFWFGVFEDMVPKVKREMRALHTPVIAVVRHKQGNFP